MKKILTTTLALALLTAAAACTPATAATVTRTAMSPYQWTGVTISQKGRTFVNFPTWNDHPDYGVGEVIDGISRPYPGVQANKQFICVQSVVTDDQDHLWILDAAKLRGKDVDPGGAKLYRVDLGSNEIDKVYTLKAPAILPNSYLNDVRIDTQRKFAYMTDSSAGGILVLNLSTGKAWRALTGIQEVAAEPQTPYQKARHIKPAASDGIELSKDGNTLYFTSLGGRHLYAIPTATLRAPDQTVKERQKAIETLSTSLPGADGLCLQGHTLYMANLPENSLYAFDLETKQGRTIDTPPVRWADTLAAAPDGTLYFTTSQLNYDKKARIPYGLYKLAE